MPFSTRPRFIAAATVLLVALAGLTLALAPNSSAGSATIVHVNTFRFCPTPDDTGCPQPNITQIQPGDSVNWLDGDGGAIPHSVEQCPDNTFINCGGLTFDSDPQTPATGSSYFLNPIQFNTQGTYYYHCEVHASMKGVIQVGSVTASPSPSPTPTDPPTPTAAPTPTASPAPTATSTPAATPTTSPTVTPTPTVSAGPTATGTTGPTETAEPTEPTDTESPTASPAQPPGDVNCDGAADEGDAIEILDHISSGGVQSSSAGCPPIGSNPGAGIVGDVNCDGLVDVQDALIVLLHRAGLPLPPLPTGCSGPG